MEALRILGELWQRRLWILLGVPIAVVAGLSFAYNISVVPLGLEQRKQLEYGAAKSQVLVVDPKRKALATVSAAIPSLTQRTETYARIATSPEVSTRIAAAAGIPLQQLYVEGPYKPKAAKHERESSQEKRSNELLADEAEYRLRIEVQEEYGERLPVMGVYATAPTASEAARLANAVAPAIRGYVESLGATSNVRRINPVTGDVVPVPPGPRPISLGRAVDVTTVATQAAAIDEGIDRVVAVGISLGVLAFWVLTVFFVSGAVNEAGRATTGARPRDHSAKPSPASS